MVILVGGFVVSHRVRRRNPRVAGGAKNFREAPEPGREDAPISQNTEIAAYCPFCGAWVTDMDLSLQVLVHDGSVGRGFFAFDYRCSACKRVVAAGPALQGLAKRMAAAGYAGKEDVIE